AREEGTVEVQVVQHGPAQGDQQEVGQDEGDDGHGGWPGWAALIVRGWGSGRPMRTGLEGPVVALRTRLSWELPLNNVNYYVFVSDNTSHSWVGFVQCIHVLNIKRTKTQVHASRTPAGNRRLRLASGRKPCRLHAYPILM